MLIKNIDLYGAKRDVRVIDGIITELSANLTGKPDVNGQGCALLPGLHDHHIHLNATAAAMNSVKCGPPDVKNEAALVKTLKATSGSDVLRGIGYHESVAGDIDSLWLDKNGPQRPVRIQHRSGRLWILNSRALDLIEADVPKDGRILDDDTLMKSAGSFGFPDLAPLVQKLLSLGITGVTEVTPRNGVAEFQNYIANAQPLKLSIMGRDELSQMDDARIGPVKFHYHEDHLPALSDWVDEIKAAHASGRSIAAHCVTRSELMLLLTALEDAGPIYGDRIEHCAIADDFMLPWMKKLNITVVTQPNFIGERGEAYANDVPVSDHFNLWRLNSLLNAGLNVAAGSDAPFGDLNPWKAMAAAVDRNFENQVGEGVSPETALALYTKPCSEAAGVSRKIDIGVAADLCLIDRPWSEARKNLSDVKVRATWVDGKLVYDAIN